MTAVRSEPLARQVSFFTDISTIARRALRSLLREPEFLGPALAIPVFFFIVNTGALETFVEQIPGIDYKAFQLPVGIVFAVTGLSRALILVTDIQSGYLDRMLITPVRRVTLLLGLMVAYALCLRPMGFLISTSAFLILGSFILGERKWHVMVPIALFATLVVWYLVQQVLGIYMRPLPGFLGG